MSPLMNYPVSGWTNRSLVLQRPERKSHPNNLLKQIFVSDIPCPVAVEPVILDFSLRVSEDLLSVSGIPFKGLTDTFHHKSFYPLS